jgi:ATP-dependent RNA helicase DDX35
MLLAAAPVPEMQRADLTGTVLQLKALGIDNILNFDWLSPPPAEALVAALELLHALGALDLDARLTTPLGTCRLEETSCVEAQLHVDPRSLGAV